MSPRKTDLRGNSRDRARRRAWLLATFGDGTTAPCWRCGCELDDSTVTADRVIPGTLGGRYVRANLRPACTDCQSSDGGALTHLTPEQRIATVVAAVELALPPTVEGVR